MELTYEYKLRFRPAGDEISDQAWELRRRHYIDCWARIGEILGRRDYDLGDYKYTVEASWQPMLHSHRHYASVMQEIDKARARGEYDVIAHGRKFQSARRSVPIRVTVSGPKPSNQTSLGFLTEAVAKCYICDIFLISSLAAPGSCNFRGATLSKVGGNERNKIRDDDVSLSDQIFEAAAVQAQESPWPPVRYLRVDDVVHWYFTHRSGLSQVATDRVERALFCILYMAKDSDGPTQLVWIFHALEEMTGTTEGQGRRMLRDRIRALLVRNQQQDGALNKKFKDLYEMRSEFVHGGLDLIHPLSNEFLQDDVSEEYWKFVINWDFGFRLLLASIQETILRGWLQPEFSIEMSGAPTPKPCS